VLALKYDDDCRWLGFVGRRAGHIAPAANVYHPARAPLTTFTPLPSRKICSSSELRDDHWRLPELRAQRESVGAWAEFSFIADALRLLAECLTWSERCWPFLRYDARNGYLSGAECAEEAANLDRLAPYPKIEAYSSSHKPGRVKGALFQQVPKWGNRTGVFRHPDRSAPASRAGMRQ
jgi:hypothetical protein